jgi:hypothetical protein
MVVVKEPAAVSEQVYPTKEVAVHLPQAPFFSRPQGPSSPWLQDSWCRSLGDQGAPGSDSRGQGVGKKGATSFLKPSELKVPPAPVKLKGPKCHLGTVLEVLPPSSSKGSQRLPSPQWQTWRGSR